MRDLVIKPLDYPPYISVHWEDANGGHDFTIDPPLDSPAYIAKFSPSQNQFACGSDLRIDQKKVFGSPGVFVPSKGFKLFFDGEHKLLMGGFIGQKPVFFEQSGRTFALSNKLPISEDGSYFVCGCEWGGYLVLCNSNTPNAIDFYKYEKDVYVKKFSSQLEFNAIKLCATTDKLFVGGDSSYATATLDGENSKISETVNEVLYNVVNDVFIITKANGSIYATIDNKVIDPAKPNEKFKILVTTLNGNMSSDVAVVGNVTSTGLPIAVVCVYYYNYKTLQEVLCFAIDDTAVHNTSPVTTTWDATKKNNIGFKVWQNGNATGPYGLYEKSVYDDYGWLRRKFTSRPFIIYDNLIYKTYDYELDYYELDKIDDNTIWAYGNGKPVANIPSNKKLSFSYILNSKFITALSNGDVNPLLVDVSTHSVVGTFNTALPSDINSNHPTLTPYNGNGATQLRYVNYNQISVSTQKYYIFDDNTQCIVNFTPFQTQDKLFAFRLDYFAKRNNGDYTYETSNWVITKTKSIDFYEKNKIPFNINYFSIKGKGICVNIWNEKDTTNVENLFLCDDKKWQVLNIDFPEIPPTAKYPTTVLHEWAYFKDADKFFFNFRYADAKGNISASPTTYQEYGASKGFICNLTGTTLKPSYTLGENISFAFSTYTRNQANISDIGIIYTVEQSTPVQIRVFKLMENGYRVDKYNVADYNPSYRGGDCYLYNINGKIGVSSNILRGDANNSSYTNISSAVSKVSYPTFAPSKPFDALPNETVDSLSNRNMVNLSSMSRTGRHLILDKEGNYYKASRFDGEDTYDADHVFNVSYSPSGTYMMYETPDGMNLARCKPNKTYVNISKKSLTFVDGYRAGTDTLIGKDFETHPLHTKLSNFVFGKNPYLFTYLAMPAGDTLEPGVPDVSHGTSADEPLSPYGRRIVRADGDNFYRIYYDWNKNIVKSHASFDSGEIYLASTYMRSGGAESDIVLYLIAASTATPPDEHGVSDLNNAQEVDRKPVKFGPIDFSVCDVVVVAHGRDKPEDQPFTFFQLDRKAHTLTKMNIVVENWDIDAPILDVKWLNCDRIIVVTEDEVVLVDSDEDDDDKTKKKIKDRLKLKKPGAVVDSGDGNFGIGEGNGLGEPHDGFQAGKDWLRPKGVSDAIAINVFYRD